MFQVFWAVRFFVCALMKERALGSKVPGALTTGSLWSPDGLKFLADLLGHILL